MKQIFNKLTALNPSRLLKVVFSKDKISKQAALKIQKDTYGDRKNCRLNNFDRPYMEIVPFLDAPEYEIFCSAVMNLTNIAHNSLRDRAKIINILQKKAEDKKISPEQKKYLVEQLNKITL